MLDIIRLGQLMDDCSCLTKLFPLKNLSCAFANIADGSGGSSLSQIYVQVASLGENREAKDILCKNICICRLDGKILVRSQCRAKEQERPGSVACGESC